MSQNTAITVTGLKKSYKNLKVLEGISFSVQQGSIFALLGPNGAGTGGNQPDRAYAAVDDILTGQHVSMFNNIFKRGVFHG
jgi:ABC-type uncharacterized transport system ATPase subunit